MIVSLTGEFDCKIDAKGRLRLPANLLKQLSAFQSDVFVVNRGYEKHIMLYPKAVWEKKTKEITDQLTFQVKSHRQALRYFHRGAKEVQIDGSERLLLTKNLLEYADIEREVVLLAYQQQVEIWDKKSYEKMLSEEPETFGDIAEQIWGDGSLSKEQ